MYTKNTQIQKLKVKQRMNIFKCFAKHDDYVLSSLVNIPDQYT